MFLGSQEEFGNAQIADRLREVLFGLDAGNGTPVADALATALQLDRRISRRQDADAVFAALTDDAIHDLAFELAWTVKTKSASFELPLGTVMASRAPGELRIDNEVWLLDAGRPGLHPMESTRRDAHGPNLDLLHHHIRRLTRNLACRRIGLPSARFIVDTDDRHLLLFPPFDKAGGVMLQRWGNGTHAPRFCAALPEQILEYAKSIVADMRVLWKRRQDIAASAAKIRRHADAAAAAHGAKVLLLAIDLQHQHGDKDFSMYVHFEAVDEAMRKGPVLDFYHDSDTQDRWVNGPWGITGRPAELIELQALGADGRIDDIAAAVAAASPAGLRAVLAQLATDYETTVTLPSTDAPCFATLYWRDGVIKAEISMANRLEWFRDRLELRNQLLPLTLVNSLPGRIVDTFAQLPFGCPCKVVEADIRDLDLTLKLEVGERLVNCATGAIWDDPTPTD